MYPKHKGFTLIEVLLALFITAIIIAVLSFVFNTGLRSYRQGRDLLEIARKSQLILGQMTRDLVGAMTQQNYISFIGNESSVYFVSPIADPDDPDKETDLCMVGYRLDSGDSLMRSHETIGDEKVNYDNLNLQPFCEKIKSFNLRYRPVGGSWSGSAWGKQYKLPEMVEASVTIEGEYPKDNPQEKTFTTWIYLPNSTNNP